MRCGLAEPEANPSSLGVGMTLNVRQRFLSDTIDRRFGSCRKWKRFAANLECGFDVRAAANTPNQQSECVSQAHVIEKGRAGQQRDGADLLLRFAKKSLKLVNDAGALLGACFALQ